MISIIVPVYKAEAYLRRCVQAILSQTVTDFELLLIDDASPDHSGALCDELAAVDPRIAVIHKDKNEGAAAARNTGLDAATGRYITFCDSDDCVSPMWLERMVNYAAQGCLPMCALATADDELACAKPLAVPNGQPLSAAQYYAFWRAGLAGFLCNALYDGEIIRQNRLRLRCQYDKGDYNEDLLFALSYVRHIDKIVYTGYADYRYDVRDNSLSTSDAAKALYFEKYEEKYHLWRTFLTESGEERQLPTLCADMLYHALVSLNTAPYARFRHIVRSQMMQECAAYADLTKEDARVIRLVKQQAVNRLWMVYQLRHLKGRITL